MLQRNPRLYTQSCHRNFQKRESEQDKTVKKPSSTSPRFQVRPLSLFKTKHFILNLIGKPFSSLGLGLNFLFGWLKGKVLVK